MKINELYKLFGDKFTAKLASIFIVQHKEIRKGKCIKKCELQKFAFLSVGKWRLANLKTNLYNQSFLI